MVTHIVLWNLKEEAAGASREENASEINRRLEALVGQIDGLLSLKVGRNVVPGGFVLALVGQYRDLAALEFYREHPLHKEVQKFVHEVITQRVSCDFQD